MDNSNNPMSLNIICLEVRNDTELGKKCLISLGYKDDALSQNQVVEDKK